MKRFFIVLIVCTLPGAVFAAPNGFWSGPQSGQLAGIRPLEAGPYLAAEILKIQTELGQQKLGDLDVAALASLRERLSIAQQKDEYVGSISLHSAVLPGIGQFETGDTASGLGFMALNLAVIAGDSGGRLLFSARRSSVRQDRLLQELLFLDQRRLERAQHCGLPACMRGSSRRSHHRWDHQVVVLAGCRSGGDTASRLRIREVHAAHRNRFHGVRCRVLN